MNAEFGMRNAEYLTPLNYSAFRIPNSALLLLSSPVGFERKSNTEAKKAEGK